MHGRPIFQSASSLKPRCPRNQGCPFTRCTFPLSTINYQLSTINYQLVGVGHQNFTRLFKHTLFLNSGVQIGLKELEALVEIILPAMKLRIAYKVVFERLSQFVAIFPTASQPNLTNGPATPTMPHQPACPLI
jgi:hypothetical protein